MTSLPLCSSSAWTSAEVESYLERSIIPMRLACIENSGFPLVCSLWYIYQDGCIWGATHETAKVSKLLAQNPKCAFEIAPNEMPYRGVRGQGRASLLRKEAGDVLPRLINRFLGDSNQSLADWLMSRIDHEFAIKIEPQWATSWDFSQRMG